MFWIYCAGMALEVLQKRLAESGETKLIVFFFGPLYLRACLSGDVIVLSVCGDTGDLSICVEAFI